MPTEKTSTLGYALLSILLGARNALTGFVSRRAILRDYCFFVLDHDCQVVSTRWKHVGLEELFPEATVDAVEVLSPLSKGAAGISSEEAVVLAALIRILEPRVLFEIGTFRGHTTRILAHHAGEGAIVHTLDVPPEDFGRSELKQHSFDQGNVLTGTQHKPAIGDLHRSDSVAAKRIVQHLGSSDRFDFSPFSGKVDLFFIDGAHSYDFVRNDTARAIECLSENGVVAWHDLKGGFRGIVRYMKELSRTAALYHIRNTSLILWWPRGLPAARRAAKSPAAPAPMGAHPRG